MPGSLLIAGLVGLVVGAFGSAALDRISDWWIRFRRTGPRSYRDVCGKECRIR